MTTQLKRHEPLYLKHRPQSISELVGQAAVTRTLKNAIEGDRIAHAYLFTGPRGTGKTSTARILAKSLNCKGGEGPTIAPCEQCASCLEIRQGISPAVFEIDAASNNSVDDARLLIERAPLVAPGGRYKVYIIDECHMLTKEAFNALLKTIEDPPPNVVFVLATTEEHKVIPTIISRCQRLMFRLAAHNDLTAHLRNVAKKENIEITDAALEFIARRSGGGLRDALGLLDQSSLLSAPGQPADVRDLHNLLGSLQEDALLEMSKYILNRQGKELLETATKLLQEGREPAVVVQELARHFLSLTKTSYLTDAAPDKNAELSSSAIVGSQDYLQGLKEQAPQFDRLELSLIVEALDRLEQTCRRTTQPAMHLEIGLLSLCHRQDMLLVRELNDRVARLEDAVQNGGGGAGFARENAPKSVRSVSITPESPAATAPQPAPAAAPRPAQAPVQAPAAPAPASPAPTSATTYATVAATAPTAPADASAESGQTSPDELDHVWSQVLDELQRRHLPTYAACSHGVPLGLTDKEFTIGAKDTFQKTLEMKADHIKAAVVTVLNKDVQVRFKVITMEIAARPVAKARESSPSKAVASTGGDSDDDYEPESLTPAPTQASHQPAPEPKVGITRATAAEPQAPKKSSSGTTGSDRNDAALIKEAYRLFEGPGSRQITPE